MWEALAAILQTMEAMADGRANRSIYVSSLEPGVGKSTAMLAFLKAMLASHDHDGVSALICIARLNVIEKLATEGGLPRNSFAVFTADRNEKLNALGCGDPEHARILFTTHAMLERQCNGRPFAAVSAFHYDGRPRDVRVYDEAILPGRTLTVSRDSIMGLMPFIRRVRPSLADALDNLQAELKNAADRTQRLIPDLASEHDLSIANALRVVRSEEASTAVDALWGLFGKVVSIRRDGGAGNTLLEYRETLSPDIAPLLALDASARVRATYPLWKDRRGGIEKLPDAPKDYSPLTIHVWATGGGKHSFKANGKGARLIEGIVNTIKSKPAEPWLVIHHINVGRDIPKEVRELVGPNVDVSFVNWGRHNATNDYKHIPNVILAGTLFYPESFYEALTRLAAKHPAAAGNVDDVDYDDVVKGEHRHLILQAVARSKVRQCDGTKCYPTNAYIIASKRSGIAHELPTIFPGCRIVNWQPTATALKGKYAQAMAFIRESLSNGAKAVAFADVKKHIGVANAANFHHIRRHPALVEAFSQDGIIEWPRVRPSCFVRAFTTYFGDTEE
jgi:hypothetical protein